MTLQTHIKVTDTSQQLAEMIHHFLNKREDDGKYPSVRSLSLLCALKCPKIKPHNPIKSHLITKIQNVLIKTPRYHQYPTIKVIALQRMEWGRRGKLFASALNYFSLNREDHKSSTQCHIHWPLKRPFACMSAFSPQLYTHDLEEPDQKWQVMWWAYVSVFFSFLGLHLNISRARFQHEATHPTEIKKGNSCIWWFI